MYYTKYEIDDLTERVPTIDAGRLYPALICLPKEVMDRIVEELAIFVIRDGDTTGGYHKVREPVGARGIILVEGHAKIPELAQRTLLHEIAHWWLDHLEKNELDNEREADTQVTKWLDDYMNFYNELPPDVAEADYASLYRLQKLAETHFMLKWE